MAFLGGVYGGNHDLLEGLAHFDIDFAAQCQGHRSDLLCHLHPRFKLAIDSLFVGFGEFNQMHGAGPVDLFAAEVFPQLVGIERCEWRQQFGHGHQAGVERLVCRTLVGTHLFAPEAFAVEPHIPVAEIVVDEGVNESAGSGGIIALEFVIYTFY